VTEQAKTWLTPKGVQQLRNVALSAEIPTYLQDRNLALVEVLYDTGLRRAEAAQLDAEYLDLESETATVYLPGEIQKRLPSGELREDATLELSDRTRNVLRRYLRDRWTDPEAGPLFPARSSPRMTGRSVNCAIKRLAEFAELTPRTAGRDQGSHDTVGCNYVNIRCR
jgi:site-specific recombinase XerD